MKGTKYDGRKMAANKISIELIQLQSLSSLSRLVSRLTSLRVASFLISRLETETFDLRLENKRQVPHVAKDRRCSFYAAQNHLEHFKPHRVDQPIGFLT